MNRSEIIQYQHIINVKGYRFDQEHKLNHIYHIITPTLVLTEAFDFPRRNVNNSNFKEALALGPPNSLGPWVCSWQTCSVIHPSMPSVMLQAVCMFAGIERYPDVVL